MGIPVKLEVFEGPLDLLLHLIEKNKVDIYDIPISEITSQYLDYIRSMEEEDLDVLSDFLVMAATLLKIKAKMLLPVNEEEEEELKIVKRKNIDTKPMDEEEAILQMELLNHDFFVFKNVDEECVSVMYKRRDGNYGIINVK